MKTVLFSDGSKSRRQVSVYSGAALFGDPTAYVHHAGRVVWLLPGLSVDFVEAVQVGGKWVKFTKEITGSV